MKKFEILCKNKVNKAGVLLRYEGFSFRELAFIESVIEFEFFIGDNLN